MPLFRGLIALAALAGSAYAKFDSGSSNNLALYWGQNSFGRGSGELAQQRLGYYCEDPNIDMIQIAFVVAINGPGGAPQVNFANQGDICEKFPGTGLLDCPQIGEDIKKCQFKQKTIILSIGGATYSEGGFRSETEAVAAADMIWETFGPKMDSTRRRPFGDAVVDGFDLDFESNVTNMDVFANRLRKLMSYNNSKPFYLTVTPQCPYPDLNNRGMLEGKVEFDAVFVQFYNNYCGLNSFQQGGEQQNFNLKAWDNWAKSMSKNKNVKILVGAPANTGAAGSGYVEASTLASVIQYSKSFSSFGGVMLWDASQGWANGNFIATVKKALGRSFWRFRA
ncbi:Chitinase 2 [Ophidiomyces ophidiicola]|nr:Chitinase 2 [Ophidiomyces ophidiicola]